jgi:mRNA-degrading endonuclease toxin of MazEF toxin-antitoxin module
VSDVNQEFLCDQLKSLDRKARNARAIGTLPGRSLKEIQARILALVQ